MLKSSVNLLFLFLLGCTSAPIERGLMITASIDSIINPDIDISKYNNCYLQNERPKDLEYQSFYKIVKNDLRDYGINIVDTKKQANCLIIMDYGISLPQNHEEFIPLWGPTSVQSITTSSNGVANAYGLAETYGNTTYAREVGYSSSNSISNVNYNYGISGFIPITSTTYTRTLSLKASNLKGEPLWQTVGVSTGNSKDLRHIFPYLSSMVGIEIKRDTNGKKNWYTYEDELYYTNYEYNNLLYRFYPIKNIYEEYDVTNKTWNPIKQDVIQKVQQNGNKISLSTLSALQFRKKY